MIAIGSDHGGYKLKEEVKRYLSEKEIKYKDLGTNNEEVADYPDIAKKVSKSVQSGECNQGILICRSGVGMAMVANKFKKIRAANCDNEEIAKYARMHNNANVLTLGADYISESDAVCILRIWLATEFEGGRHEERIKLIEEIEAENMK